MFFFFSVRSVSTDVCIDIYIYVPTPLPSFSDAVRIGCTCFLHLSVFGSLGLAACGEADGKVIFLEANRDPSWVIDGGAKKEAGLQTNVLWCDYHII